MEDLTAEVAVVEAPAADLTAGEAAEAHPVPAAVVLRGVVVEAAAIAKAVSRDLPNVTRKLIALRRA